MRLPRRIRRYLKEELNEVLHTTLNPEGPGVVRIHLVPPETDGKHFEESVAIINGQDIVPVDLSWTILLAEFIKEVNFFSGREVTDDETELIMKRTIEDVRRVFPFVPKKMIRKDIATMMSVFTEIARGRVPSIPVGYMNMGDYAPYMKAPHRMDLMVAAMTKDGAWHCNQKCIHCYAAGQKQAEETELSTGQWKEILDRCRAAGIPQVTFTGGEPTMREDLTELIDYAQWFVTRLNTNGIRMTKEYAEALMRASLDSVQITFYSENAQIHNQLVGAAQYEKTVAGIENALAAGLSVSINTPLCTLNRDYVKTLAFLHEKGVLYVSCSGLITTGNAATETSENLQLATDEIRAILKDAVTYCYANGMEISFTSPGWIEEEFFEENGLSTPNCGACLSNMAVTPGGNVVPCQSWLSDTVLGNMLEDDWKTIWRNPECLARREFSSLMLGECPLRKPAEKSEGKNAENGSEQEGKSNEE